MYLVLATFLNLWHSTQLRLGSNPEVESKGPLKYCMQPQTVGISLTGVDRLKGTPTCTYFVFYACYLFLVMIMRSRAQITHIYIVAGQA